MSRLRLGLHLIRQRLPELQAEAKRQERLSAPRFNLFRILKVDWKEAVTHTPLIAAWLDPEGTHGQGFLFLKQFLAVAGARGLLLPSGTCEHFRWRVDTERPLVGFGCLDIVVACPDLRYLLVIENKVWAGEQPDQLRRYNDWLATQQQRFITRQLVFLTPTGRKATTAKDSDYVCLSYEQDIQRWLTICLREVKAPIVKDVVRQHLEVISGWR